MDIILMPDKYPSLYQINTRVWLTELAEVSGRPATLDDIADSDLDRFSNMGFDWIWFLSVWRTGPTAQRVSRQNPDWRRDFQETLPDLREEDIGGSGFAITGYNVHPDIGGDPALARLRKRMQKRGLKLMLDFVPNHMGPDHPWVEEHPEYFVAGTPDDLQRSPRNYTRINRKDGEMILAYGRDPYFSGWPDTLQLDYSNPSLQEAMINELLRISGQCDGIRCDMAMLVLPDVFQRTWGRQPELFWPKAIKKVREQSPDFCFMAEVYWDLEWELQQQGFDYAYDKRLYDRLRKGQARPVREHLYAGLDFQNKLARFLENHDEPRAAATFDLKVHQAAAVITFLSPGLRFFHQGQFEGRKKRISPHLVRAPKEPVDIELQLFYNKLLSVLQLPVVRQGQWLLLECLPAWDGNGSWDSFVACCWQGPGNERMLVAVNYAPHPSQCFLKLSFPEFKNQSVSLMDLVTSSRYNREGNELLERGLFVDLQPWSFHIFEVEIS
jgi:hypothetical protein